MRELRVLVVDDEHLARERLAALLARADDIEIVGQCANGIAALRTILEAPESRRPDVVFLDVQMPDLDGVEVAEGLLEAAQGIDMPELIFVTAHSDYMERAFELHAIDYLRKPYTDARFRSALDHARRRVSVRHRAHDVPAIGAVPPDTRDPLALPADSIRELRRLLATLNGDRDQDRIAVRDRATGTVQLVEVRHVVWIAANGAGQVRLHTDNVPMTWDLGIEAVDAELTPLGFLRVHRSTLINPRRLMSAKPLTKGQYMLTMSDGTRFDTGRAFASNIEAHLASLPGGG